MTTADNLCPAAAMALQEDADAAVPEWVMLARTGAWLGHPQAPEVIRPEDLAAACDYFHRHYAAHGADLVIDYHHASINAPADGAPAAGWVRAMELRNGGAELWGRVLWTGQAAAAIARRQFRYVSPVFRFNRPDRVSGEAVPLQIHSVALTNTPFLTELHSLNESAGRDPRGHGQPRFPDGGEKEMPILESLASALECAPGRVAERLGLAADAEERAVAERIMERAKPPAVCAEVANALDVEPDADAARARAAVLALKAAAAAVRERLQLPAHASDPEVINALDVLCEGARSGEAERLVDEAVREGRIPPAHRGFYLREALNDLRAAREVINCLPVLTAPARGPQNGTRADLSEGERAVCAQLALSPEQMAAARPTDD